MAEKKKKRRRPRRTRSPFLYVYIYGAVILLGNSLPAAHIVRRLSRINQLFEYIFSDKTFHFVLFGFFAWLLCYGYHKTGRKKTPYVRIFLLSMAYGTLIEVWQALLPYRHFDKRDVLFDLFGIVAFLIGFWIMRRFGILLKKK
jgi:VanZ family protein